MTRMRMQPRMEAIEAARRAEVNGSFPQARAHRESCERVCPPALLVKRFAQTGALSGFDRLVLLFFSMGAG